MSRCRWQIITVLLCLAFGSLAVLPATLALADDVVLVGAGDIASCASTGDEATAALLATIPGTVVTLGDNVYSDGTDAQFANCYDPSWGQQKTRTFPAPGNHDYHTAGAAGYFNYFGAAAGDPTKGYYSYDLGDWHIVVINSNCSQVGGCQAGSAQEQWLRADLAAHPAACTLAYWHHPRFSSGTSHGSDTRLQPIWQALYEAGADVVLNRHDHDYERFAPQDPAGNTDSNGIREFVVGTGGSRHGTVGSPIANSEVRNDTTFGVLKLTLHATSYEWEFVPVAGQTFSDTGSGTCVDISSATPKINSLTPPSATAGGPDFSLAVNGANFASDATVQWNGSDRPTTFVDSTQLLCDISTTDITTPGSANVTVVQPISGGTSNAKTFTITIPASNLLLNDGFEADSSPADGKPDSWNIRKQFTRSNEVVHSGGYAGKLFATTNADYTTSQTVDNLNPGIAYRYSGWVNIPSTRDTFTFKLQVRWINKTGNTISTVTIKTYSAPTNPGSNNGWDTTTTSLVAPPGTKSAEVRMVVSSLKATIYVDDFVFGP